MKILLFVLSFVLPLGLSAQDFTFFAQSPSQGTVASLGSARSFHQSRPLAFYSLDASAYPNGVQLLPASISRNKNSDFLTGATYVIAGAGLGLLTYTLVDGGKETEAWNWGDAGLYMGIGAGAGLTVFTIRLATRGPKTGNRPTFLDPSKDYGRQRWRRRKS